MAALILPSRFYRQPQGNVAVDWSNPLCTGLAALVNGYAKVELVDQITGTTSGGGGYTQSAGQYGMRRAFARASAAMDQYTKSGFSGDLTLFLVGGITGTLAGTQVVIGGFAGTTKRFWLGENSNSHMTFVTSPSGGSTVAAGLGGSGDNIYVAVLSGTAMTLYKNGVSISTGTQAASNWSDVDRISIGSTGFLENPGANIYLAGYAQRAWSQSEIQSFSANPWQLFKPSAQRLVVNTVAAPPGGSFQAAWAVNSNYIIQGNSR